MRVFGSTGKGEGQFRYPMGCAVDFETGNILICDTLNHRIQTVDVVGHYISHFGSNGNHDGEFQSPQGIAVDRYGQIVVTDGTRVQIFSKSGQFLKKLVFNPQGQATERSLPQCVAIGQQGNIYVLYEGETSRVVVFG